MELIIKKEPFKILFARDWAHRGDWLESTVTYWERSWYLKIFGFRYLLQLCVTSDGVLQGNCFEYEVQYKRRSLYWLTLKVLENGKINKYLMNK